MSPLTPLLLRLLRGDLIAPLFLWALAILIPQFVSLAVDINYVLNFLVLSLISFSGKNAFVSTGDFLEILTQSNFHYLMVRVIYFFMYFGMLIVFSIPTALALKDNHPQYDLLELSSVLIPFGMASLFYFLMSSSDSLFEDLTVSRSENNQMFFGVALFLFIVLPIALFLIHPLCFAYFIALLLANAFTISRAGTRVIPARRRWWVRSCFSAFIGLCFSVHFYVAKLYVNDSAFYEYLENIKTDGLRGTQLGVLNSAVRSARNATELLSALTKIEEFCQIQLIPISKEGVQLLCVQEGYRNAKIQLPYLQREESLMLLLKSKLKTAKIISLYSALRMKAVSADYLRLLSDQAREAGEESLSRAAAQIYFTLTGYGPSKDFVHSVLSCPNTNFEKLPGEVLARCYAITAAKIPHILVTSSSTLASNIRRSSY